MKKKTNNFGQPPKMITPFSLHKNNAYTTTERIYIYISRDLLHCTADSMTNLFIAMQKANPMYMLYFPRCILDEQLCKIAVAINKKSVQNV